MFDIKTMFSIFDSTLKCSSMPHFDDFCQAEEKSKEKAKEDGEKKEGEGKSESEKAEVDLSMQQSVAVLGLALVAMGEDIGSEMLFR